MQNTPATPSLLLGVTFIGRVAALAPKAFGRTIGDPGVCSRGRLGNSSFELETTVVLTAGQLHGPELKEV